MIWKEFLRPDLKKVITFIIIAVLGISYIFLFSLLSGLSILDLPSVLIFGVLIGNYYEFGRAILVNALYWYVLSCLIIWIYNKVKKKK